MNTTFAYWHATRKNIELALEGYSIEQLNLIPPNFNNNLAWQFGHVLVTQQLLCYSLSGLEPLIDKTAILKYRKGTKPTEFISAAEISELREFNQMIKHQMEEDYSNGLFQAYKKYGTSYGIEVHTIDEAIYFNNLHEAMHLGYIMSIRKLV